jgi:ATP-dependent Clp protease ATP-binding subunit ClpC
MFERVSKEAGRVLASAMELARKSGAEFVGTEHLLLGILENGGGAAAGFLANLGVTRERVEA